MPGKRMMLPPVYVL